MSKNLVILPFNTELSKQNLQEIIITIDKTFRKIYSNIELLENRFVYPENASSVFAPDVLTGQYNLLNGNPLEGIHRMLGARLKNAHGLILTDMLINYAGFRVGGTADLINQTALATTFDIPGKEKLISRFLGIIIHELGHLYGLEHHDSKVSAKKYCPMINRGWRDKEFESELALNNYLDSRSKIFCEKCYDVILK